MKTILEGEERQLSAVYMIGSGRGKPCKIGVSDDVQKRLKQLQNGHADKLRLWGIWYFTSRSTAGAAEKFLHDIYRERRMTGEWFDIDPAWIAPTVGGLFVVGLKQAPVCYDAVQQPDAVLADG